MYCPGRESQYVGDRHDIDTVIPGDAEVAQDGIGHQYHGHEGPLDDNLCHDVSLTENGKCQVTQGSEVEAESAFRAAGLGDPVEIIAALRA